MTGYGGQGPQIVEGNYYVYILRCSDGSTYTGCTRDLQARLVRHNKGHVASTKGKLPVKIITYVVFTDKYKAYAFEKYLKSGSGRETALNIVNAKASTTGFFFSRTPQRIS